jgi:hypothetical protein
MTMKRSLALLCLALACATAAQACPRSADRSLVGPSVGQDMVVNGLPVQIQQVSSPDSIETLLGRVERAWKDAGFAVKRQSVGPWQVLSALSDDCLTTLQLRAAGGTVGLFAIGQPHKNKGRGALVKRSGVVLPSGAHVVSVVAAGDGPRDSTTITINSKRSVSELREHFLQALRDAGYGNVRAHEIRRRGAMQRAHIVSGQRAGEVVEIVVFDHEGTTAVINQGQGL